MFGLLHEKLDLIYNDDCCGHVTLAPKKDKYKRIKTSFDKAVEHIHEQQGFTAGDLSAKPVKDLTQATFSILKDAINTGITHQVPDVMRQALEKSVYVFSGLKSYVSLKEASGMLFDDKGGIKPIAQFKQEAQKINATYNDNYIDAEYRFAVQSATGADNWHQYQQDGDRYYLQFRTAGDSKVRKEHAALNGTTLPFDDPFWEIYWTPLGWRCRCKIVQVRKGKYDLSDSETANKLGEAATTALDKDGKNKAAMFRFNPGKDLVIFPPKHPYNAIAPKAAKAIITKQAP